jgi:hypothetical protein
MYFVYSPDNFQKMTHRALMPFSPQADIITTFSGVRAGTSYLALTPKNKRTGIGQPFAQFSELGMMSQFTIKVSASTILPCTQGCTVKIVIYLQNMGLMA